MLPSKANFSSLKNGFFSENLKVAKNEEDNEIMSSFKETVNQRLLKQENEVLFF